MRKSLCTYEDIYLITNVLISQLTLAIFRWIKISQTQLQYVRFIFTRCSLSDCMFRLSSLGHHQVVSLNRGNYTLYNMIQYVKFYCYSTRSRSCCHHSSTRYRRVHTTNSEQQRKSYTPLFNYSKQLPNWGYKAEYRKHHL